jgi:hypothetical protein
MTKRHIIVLALVASCALSAPAHAQKTKAQINTEIGVLFPDNHMGAITPSILRNVTSDIVNSIMPTAPVVSNNLACYSGTTGLLKDCGFSPVTVPLTVGSTIISGGITNGILYDNAGVLGNLATLNYGVLTTNSSGAPSITNSITLPNAGSGGSYSALDNSGTAKQLLALRNNSGAADSTQVQSGGGSVTLANSTGAPIATFFENGQIGIGTITPATGSLIDVRNGSINNVVTNPTLAIATLGFEPLTNFVGMSSFVTFTSAASSTGVAMLGQAINQKGGVAAGVQGGVRDDFGSENYGAIGVLTVNHSGGGGAAGGYFIRNVTGSIIPPNPTLYSGQNGFAVGNETIVPSAAANAAIGLYVYGLCDPESAVSIFCPQGATNDNTFVVGGNFLNARDEMLRLGSNQGNGHLAPSLIKAYAHDNSVVYNLTSSAQITSKNSAAPASPAAGYAAYWTDSTTGRFNDKSTAGTVGTTAVPHAATSNNFLTGLNADGTFTNAQPSFSNLSGSVTCAQEPAFTGDVTTSAGTCANVLATVNANVGSFGSATQASTFTVNGKGLITAAANVTITPAISNLTGAGTGVLTALGINIGTAGSFVTNGGALGTPTSGSAANLTGLPTTSLTGALQAAQEPAHTGDVTNTAGSLALSIANNAVTLAKLATQATNTVLGNATSGSAVPTALSVPSCSTAASALIWTTNTGFGCNVISATATSMTVGTTTVLSGATTKVLFDNAGVLGEYTISGSGNVAMTASPTFTGTLTAASVAGSSATITSNSALALSVSGSRATDFGISLNINNSAASGHSWVVSSDGGGLASVGSLVFYDNTASSVRGYFGSSGGLSVGSPTGGDKGLGTLNFATGLYANGSKGVTCSGALTVISSVTITNGIVTAATGTGGTCS